MALSYGIAPVLVDEADAKGETPWATLETRLTERFDLRKGQIIVVVGDPAASHRESTVGIHVVGMQSEPAA